MIQIGKNITIKDDVLGKIKTEYLYHAIRNPADDLEQKVRQLRTIATIDKSQYSNLKKMLPYVVCGIFYPPVRKSENFAWLQHFVLDFDHLGEKNLEPEMLKKKLRSDSRVELIFISPGGDGLKVMFKLSEKCYDKAKYSLFYKVFARMFSRQYNLDQVIDPRTSDVTRACFLSCDINVYYNAYPDEVTMKSFVDFDNPLEAKEIASTIRKDEKENAEATVGNLDAENKTPADTILEEIKKTLNPSLRKPVNKQIYVPAELEDTIMLVNKKMSSLSINVDSVRDIHYGKKFAFSLGLRKAEINLFYGKRGFSVVVSPKVGTDKDLNEICATIMQQLFIPGLMEFSNLNS